MNQRGFATLEVILMVMVIGILASIAVPRFTNVTAAANTAKIQADLSTIDTAIAVYQMEKGKTPESLDALKDYFQGGTSPTPPTGKYFLEGTIQDTELTASSKYGVADVGETGKTETRAIIEGTTNTAEKFYVRDKSSTGGSAGTGGGEG